MTSALRSGRPLDELGIMVASFIHPEEKALHQRTMNPKRFPVLCLGQADTDTSINQEK